jgi:phosphatidylglycerol:prolipoprotein diacylglycerol transferase
MNGPLPFPDITPEIFSVTVFGFELALRWYAMGYIVGIAIGWQVIAYALRRPHLWKNDTPFLDVSKLDDLLTYVVIGGIAGGRIGYTMFYNASYYLANPIEILMVWQGGMSFHGSMIGILISMTIFSYRHKVHLGSLLDSIAISAFSAIFLVRITNFINAELWGRPTDVPWAVAFPGEAAQACATAAQACGRHPSQLYEAGLEGLVVGAVLLILTFRFRILRFPWAAGGVFLIGYGVSRFLVEFVRQPDAQFITAGNPLGLAFHIDGFGLTMGQTLTLPMIIGGIVLIVLLRRQA